MKLKQRMIPPVSTNLQWSLDKSPLNSNILEDSKNENNSLSFSNKDLQMLQYKKYKKYSRRCPSLSENSSDLALFLIDYEKSSMQ